MKSSSQIANVIAPHIAANNAIVGYTNLRRVFIGDGSGNIQPANLLAPRDVFYRNSTDQNDRGVAVLGSDSGLTLQALYGYDSLTEFWLGNIPGTTQKVILGIADVNGFGTNGPTPIEGLTNISAFPSIDRITYFRLSPAISGGIAVHIDVGVYAVAYTIPSGGFGYFDSQEFGFPDPTDSIIFNPAGSALTSGQHAIVGIAINPTAGAPFAIQGTPATATGTLPSRSEFVASDYEAINFTGYIPCGFIYTYFGQTDIVEDDCLRLFDPRYFISAVVSGGPPSSLATYITQTPNASLPNAEAISALGSGYLKGTTGTGVITSQATPIPLVDGGTHADLSGTGPGFLKQATSGANVTVTTLADTDLPILPQLWKMPVRVASTTNVNLAAPGASMDGVSLNASDRVLLKNQATQSQNGPWIWNGASSALTRPTDFASGNTVQASYGVTFYVRTGNTNGGTAWYVNNTSSVTIDTTSIGFNETEWNISVVFGVLPVTNGGTGLATLTAHSLLTGNGTSAVGFITAGSAGHYPRSNGTDYVDAAIVATDYAAFVASGASHAQGAVPDPGATAGTSLVLREDATWSVPHSIPLLFGDGSDGALSASSGTTTLSKDTYYSSIALSGTAKIDTNGWRLFCQGNLDISAAGADAITNSGNTGGNASAGGGGSAAAAIPAQTVGGGAASAVGGAGGVGANASGSSGSGVVNQTSANGGKGGAGGAGGKGTGTGAVGPSASGGTVAGSLSIRRLAFDLVFAANQLTGGASGGSAGGGAQTTSGAGTCGGGGSGGSGAGIVWIAARNIVRGTNSTAGIISAKGGGGGNGASSSAVGNGDGGGGGGGGGGQVYLIYETISGSQIINGIQATGGSGGNAGSTGTTSPVANGGTGGDGGRITKIALAANGVSEVVGSAGSANTGRSGGAGGACNANL